MAFFKLLVASLFFINLFTIRPCIACYKAIFSFGDSLADTGNFVNSPSGKCDLVGKFPYGETYFHYPTGRYSDGRVVLDFIAKASGLPYVQPYLGRNCSDNFRYGANFAVGGATALDNDFFRGKGFNVTWTTYSLSVQLRLLQELIPSLCHSDSECDEFISKSLFLVGEIGGNDYNHAFFQGRQIDEIRAYVPNVVDAIISAVDKVIKIGAKMVVVPGNLPIGCISAFLNKFHSARRDDYEKPGCLKRLNGFAKYHNRLLRHELNKLQKLHPNVTIIYANNYEATYNVLLHPKKHGFKKIILDACCGGGGLYNYNSDIHCGAEGMMLCKDLSKYFCWDGMHLTEATYKAIAEGLLGPYTSPSISQFCPQIQDIQRVF